jgi:hypothetical protein
MTSILVLKWIISRGRVTLLEVILCSTFIVISKCPGQVLLTDKGISDVVVEMSSKNTAVEAPANVCVAGYVYKPFTQESRCFAAFPTTTGDRVYSDSLIDLSATTALMYIS